MLVTIQPGIGNVSTDVKTRFFNFLASLHAVSTASAGSSPVVNPVNTSGVKDTNYNCITVISNTEGGGWSAGVSNNITASTSYNTSFSSPYLVDLYRSTGKSTYPYYRQLFGNYTYPFNSSFTSYPQANINQGHTSNDPASVIYSSDTNWYNGNWSFVRSTNNWTTYPTNALLDISTATTYYVAVTGNYLIITQPNAILYFGIRDVSPWELTRTDNPPWCSFGMNGFNVTTSSSRSQLHILSWTAGLNPDNTQSAPAKRGYQRDLSSTSFDIGFDTNNGTRNIYSYFKGLFSPACISAASSTSNYFYSDVPVTDPTTGLSVPPAYPMIFNYSYGTNGASIGQIPGILKGMSQTATGLANFAGASEYIVNGTAYQPVLTINSTYPDLFLLRKA